MAKKSEVAQKISKTGAPKSVKAKVTAPVVTPKPLTSIEKLEKIGIEAICQHVENFGSLRGFCLEHAIPLMTANDWIDRDSTRAVHYARAREARADLVFESLDEVSNDAVNAENAVQVAGLRLKADNIKWKLARMNAKKYGDKQTIDLNAEVITLTEDQRKARLLELQAKLALPTS